MKQQESSFTADGNAKCTVTLESSLAVSYKAKYGLSIWSSNHTPRYLLSWAKNVYAYKVCTKMFTATLIVIPQNWKQPRCLLIGDWMNKLWYNHTMEYYSAIKISVPSSYEKTWRNLKRILPSERSPSKKVLYYMISIIWYSRKGRPI